MKTLVLYYSKTGSNKYLSERIARSLEADIEAVRPRMNVFPALMLFSFLKVSMGIKALAHNVKEYDRVILYGPVWAGRLISPLRDVISKYRNSIRSLYFITCCGSSDAEKENRFGYAAVFTKVKNVLGDKCALCEAFPIGLVLPEDKAKDGDAIMNTRLSDSNFIGQIKKRAEDFIKRVAER
ncbi:MAG: hypothetical protein JW768_08095 [Chitinispirillaceae bacterium]|nr:hypothetical protein [Chitinispirillaceae bacterium]